MDLVDVEEESVLTAVFKDSFPESWQSDPSFIQYLSELSSFGVEKLAQEPERLCEEKTQILEETQNLAFQNYKTFIQTAECSREIFQDFQIIEGHVEDLLQKLPVFADRCSSVLQAAQDITASRKMASLTLQRHTQLLEVLELPQLMDTCVRNAYYDEALELAAHVKRLEKKHSNIPIIASIVGEVQTSSQLMLNQLIHQLRTNVQLPACLRVIGYLRRMHVFTELELRIKFLQARDTWFQGILEAIPKEDAYTHISKTVEASRVHLFDIITQYRAIFTDEDPLLATNKDDTMNEGALFHTWIVQKVSQFLTSLEGDLSRGVGGRLDSILGQCMYFGQSFSRVGADFRPLLAPVFHRAAGDGFRQALHQANKRFEELMRSYSLLSSGVGVSGLPYNPAAQGGNLYPPTVLLEFHPLAAYCNDLLSAFNDLRLCAPIAMVTEVTEALRRSFLEVNRIILAFHRAEETTFDARERGKFEGFLAAYSSSLLPYMNKCLQALYPPTQLAQILGLTVSEMNKLGVIGQVDVGAVLKPIEHLLPAVEPDMTDNQPRTSAAASLDQPRVGGPIPDHPHTGAPTPDQPQVSPAITASFTDPLHTSPPHTATPLSSVAPTMSQPAVSSLPSNGVETTGDVSAMTLAVEGKATVQDANAPGSKDEVIPDPAVDVTEAAVAGQQGEADTRPSSHEPAHATHTDVTADPGQEVRADTGGGHKDMSPGATFSLPDDDDQVDIDQMDVGAVGTDDVDELDIDRDLSALADDVLKSKKH